MCYGCRPTCDDCRPKFVFCAACGSKNFLFSRACKSCGAPLTDEMKSEARELWKKQKQGQQ